MAQNDTVYDNDTSSRPTLAIGGSGEAMVLYPSRANGGYSFFASLVTNGVPSQPVMVSDSSTNWAGWGEYYGEWYDGDSRGAVVYDPTQLRFVIAYPDRRNGRSPRLYSAAYGDINLRQIFMPLIRR